MPGSRWPVAVSDDDFGTYLADMPQASIRLFWRFITLARSCGPVTFELQRPGTVLRGTRRIFASAGIGSGGLQGHIVLPRQLPDRRIRRTAPLTKHLFGNWYAVSSDSDLDQEFARWLCEARDIGDGAHLVRGAGEQQDGVLPE
jgi:hypothetical protein